MKKTEFLLIEDKEMDGAPVRSTLAINANSDGLWVSMHEQDASPLLESASVFMKKEDVKELINYFQTWLDNPAAEKDVSGYDVYSPERSAHCYCGIRLLPNESNCPRCLHLKKEWTEWEQTK